MRQYAIKGRYMRARFKLVCGVMGWNCEGEMFTGKGETRGSNPGYTWIQRGANPSKAYYRIVQMTGRDYGERVLSDNYTPSELSAWFDGILKAHETLAKLHSDMVLSVDSLRGNEKFAAQAILNSL